MSGSYASILYARVMDGDSCPGVLRTRHPFTLTKPPNTRKTATYAKTLENAEIHIHKKSAAVLCTGNSLVIQHP